VDIVNRAMAKADSDRFPSAAQFAKGVEETMNQLYPNSTLLSSSHRYMSL
jgi:hypothetical protein